MAQKKLSSKKKKVSKNTVILGNFNKKFVDQIRQNYINSNNPSTQQILTDNQIKKVYSLKATIGTSNIVIDKKSPSNIFYCTGAIVNVSLTKNAYTAYSIDITMAKKLTGGSYGVSSSMYKKHLDLPISHELTVQLIFTPPLEFNLDAIAVLFGDTIHTLLAEEFVNIDLYGYELPLSQL